MLIEERYQGFPGIALGGITAGLVARRVGDEAEVFLKRPVPTEKELRMQETENGVELLLDGELAALARPTSVDLELPDPVSPEEARRASGSFLGHHDHPFPSCFTCGTRRSEGDGLRIFAGGLEDRPCLAAPWTPHPSHGGPEGEIPMKYLWAAVDCPSIWALMEAAPRDSSRKVVTGRLALRRDHPVRADVPHVIVTWPLELREDTWPAGAVVFDAEGLVKAVAQHTLVFADWGVPLGVPGGQELHVGDRIR